MPWEAQEFWAWNSTGFWICLEETTMWTLNMFLDEEEVEEPADKDGDDSVAYKEEVRNRATREAGLAEFVKDYSLAGEKLGTRHAFSRTHWEERT
jgi:hypothetical protein